MLQLVKNDHICLVERGSSWYCILRALVSEAMCEIQVGGNSITILYIGSLELVCMVSLLLKKGNKLESLGSKYFILAEIV